MTRAETAKLLATIRALWPHNDLGDLAVAVEVWGSLFEEVPKEIVDDALKEYIAAGERHAPGAPALLALAVERENDVPDWDEAWAEIGRLQAYYSPAMPGREVPPPEAFCHPAIAFFAIPSWKELCMAPAPGTREFGTHYAQTREAYKALSSRAKRDGGLALLGAPRKSARGELRGFGQTVPELLPGADDGTST